MDAGSREENASKQQSRASLLIQSETKMLWRGGWRLLDGPDPVLSGERLYPNTS
jgi:hypothetical protein